MITILGFKKHKRSITLIEAVTVIVIFAVIAATAGSILFTTSRSGTRLVDKSKAFQDENWAVEYMINEARWGVNFIVSPDPFADFDLITFQSDIDHDGIDAAVPCDDPYVWYWRGFTTTVAPITVYGNNTVLYRGVDNACNTDFEASFQLANDNRQELTTFVVDNPDNSGDPFAVFDYSCAGLRFILTVQSPSAPDSQTLRASVVPLNDGSNISSGLVAYYHFDGNANDAVGGNNGNEIGGINYVVGQVGLAKSFDGNGDYVEILHDSSFDFTDEIYSVSFWMSANSDNTAYVFAKSTQGAGYGTYKGYAGNSQMRVVHAGAGGVSSTNNAYTIGDWTHFVMVSDGTNISIYRNGSLDNSEPVSFDITDTTGNLRIGIDENGDYDFDGQIDEVRIYDRALTRSEVCRIYQQER